MSQNYRQDSRYSYNSRPYENQRQLNRSSYHQSSSYKEPQNYRSQRRDGDYQDTHKYKTKQDGQFENDNFGSGSCYRPSSTGHYSNRESDGYKKYNKSYQENYKEIQQRQYSRDVRPYKKYEDRYDRNYDSRYEKRSRSRSKDKEHYAQQTKDYSKRSGVYESKSYHQSYSSYNRYQKTIDQSLHKNIGIDSHHKTEKNYSICSPINIKNMNQKVDQKKQPHKKYQRQNYQRQTYRKNEPRSYVKDNQKYQTKQINPKIQKREEQPKNFISIEVKSRQRSPNPKEKKSRKSQSSQSRSLSKSRRSKEHSKRKHNKKHRSISSSSHSSSYSSSSSSSSSNRSSSSSSSRSSSSSYSRSEQSRRYKNKQRRDFYNQNSSQFKYGTPNYSNRENYQVKYQSKRNYEYSNVGNDQDKIGQRKYQKNQRQISIKQSKVQKLRTIEQKLIKEREKTDNNEEKYINKSQIENLHNEKDKFQKQKIQKQHLSISEKDYQPYLTQKTGQQRDSNRKYPYNRGNYQSYSQNYQNSRQFYNYNQFQNQNKQFNVNQQSQISQSSINQANMELNVPSYPNRVYSGQNPRIGFLGQNDSQKKNFMNQSFRRPFINTYQNYPPPQANLPQNNYQNNFGNPPFQKYNQGFGPHRLYQKNFYHNRNYYTQQPNLPPNNFNNTFLLQNQMPYQNNFQPQLRRINSQMTGQRKSSYFQAVTQNKENQLNKTQINKLQTEKQDLALIQKAFKRQSELKKIKQLIPCSKTLQLIQKARQNLSIPAIKPKFLLLDLFKQMNDFKKQTMNSNLRSILEEDFENKYNQQKAKVFQNLRLLDLDKNQSKQNQQNVELKQATLQVSTFQESKQDEGKMDEQNNQNPEQVQRPNQFIWKKPQMSQNLRQLKSNIQMLRKASSSLSQLNRKIKIKETKN